MFLLVVSLTWRPPRGDSLEQLVIGFLNWVLVSKHTNGIQNFLSWPLFLILFHPLAALVVQYNGLLAALFLTFPDILAYLRSVRSPKLNKNIKAFTLVNFT